MDIHDNRELECVMPKLLKVPEMSKYLQCSRQQVLALLGCGAIRGFKVANQWRATEEAMADFIKRQEELMNGGRKAEEAKDNPGQ